MMTQSGRLPDPPTTIHLLDARAFPTIASRAGIRESARTLVMDDRLVPVVIGSRTYYRWMDVLPLMPEWARRQYAVLGRAPGTPGGRRYDEALAAWAPYLAGAVAR